MEAEPFFSGPAMKPRATASRNRRGWTRHHVSRPSASSSRSPPLALPALAFLLALPLPCLPHLRIAPGGSTLQQRAIKRSTQPWPSSSRFTAAAHEPLHPPGLDLRLLKITSGQQKGTRSRESAVEPRGSGIEGLDHPVFTVDFKHRKLKDGGFS